MNYIDKLDTIIIALGECNNYLPEDKDEVNKKINDINALGNTIVEIGGQIQKETNANPLNVPEYAQAARLFNSKRLSLKKAINKRQKEMRLKWLKEALDSGKIIIEGPEKAAVAAYIAEEEFKANVQEANKSPQQMFKEHMNSLNHITNKSE